MLRIISDINNSDEELHNERFAVNGLEGIALLESGFRFDCIILDEAHHVTADTYQKIMKHFEPKLWLGMTATPDKRDDNIAGKNVYELFNYQIAYEIRL